MSPILSLDATYRGRALPAASRRYWSWLFAARNAQAPLLGLYALTAEWRSLLADGTEPGVTRLKLAWWQEEIGRLCAGTPLHPITRYLAHLPGAAGIDWAPLETAARAALGEADGVPLERTQELAPHAIALYGAPLSLASRLIEPHADLRASTDALGVAEYLSTSLKSYRRLAHRERIPFAVEELLAAGIENTDLRAVTAPAHLSRYLEELRVRARASFELATRAIPAPQRVQHRHLAVLAALGVRHLQGDHGRRPLRDMLIAWSTAREMQR